MPKLKQEIFAVGTWNKMSFNLANLQSMVASFKQLGTVLKVPLKLGHNDKQAVTDGQPALGWVTELEVIGDKLVATFDHVPDIIFKAFQKKLYRNVSLELDMNVKHKGTVYDFVVTAVALLGADMPAVNVLNDLAAFFNAGGNGNIADGGYDAGEHLTFVTLTGNREDTTMKPEEEAELRKQLAEAKSTSETAKAKFAALEKTQDADKVKFEAEKAAFEKDQDKIKIDAARSVFTTMLEKAVTDKAITPAQREAFTKALRIDDDAAVLLIKEEDVKALFGAADDKGKFSKASGKDEEDDANKDDPSQSLVEKTYASMSESGEKNFNTAMFSVMRANPGLAREYVDSNGEVS